MVVARGNNTNKLNGDFKAIARILREFRADIEELNIQVLALKADIVNELQTSPFANKHFINEAMNEVFNAGELGELVFRISERERLRGGNEEIISLTYDSLGGIGKTDRALELVLFMRRNGRYADLIDALSQVRPFVDWERFV